MKQLGETEYLFNVNFAYPGKRLLLLSRRRILAKVTQTSNGETIYEYLDGGSLNVPVWFECL